MLIKVVDANYVKGHEIEITFNDGFHATIDLKDHLQGEIFKPQRSEAFFRNFRLNRWTIEWENGADFAPEFLHELALKESKGTQNTGV